MRKRETDGNGGGGLARLLGRIDVFSIAAGAMISSGLFILPGLVYGKVGPAVIIAYILAGILVLPALFAKIELMTAMPKAGGSYFFVERSMGSAAGTIGGLASWFSLALKSAFALVGIGVLVSLVDPGFTVLHGKLVALGFCVLFTLLNIRSVKVAGRCQVGLVLVLLALLALYILFGSASLEINRYSPFLPEGTRMRSLLMAAGMVFISFGGLTKVASVAEEVRDPARTIPFATIAAFSVVLLVYALTVFVTVGLLDGAEFKDSLTPLSDGGRKMLGRTGVAVMAVAGVLAFISTANAGLLAASRFLLAMSRDQLLPSSLSRVSGRFKTPHIAVLVTGAFMAVVVIALDIEVLAMAASAMKIMLFGLVILSCVIMRESRILNYKPTFVSPLYPWLHGLGLVCYCFLLYEMGAPALAAVGGFIVVCMAWYWSYFKGRAVRKSALVHVVERVIDRRIAGDSLGRELREILKERDEIVEDRFDELVLRCQIADLEAGCSYKEFFAEAAGKLSGQLGVEKDVLLQSLLAREREATTEIRPGLAIPHVSLEGKGRFELMIARCQDGIQFAEDMPGVYAVFILAGSRDERNFHLRALAAIAQITQDANFDRDWLRAKNVEELRDIVLLGKRRREKAPRS